MLPKVESVDDVLLAEKALERAGAGHLPLHVLIESAAAVHRAFEIAAHPRVQSLSFGLMDFVSAHGGAIPASAMGSAGQFSHPLVVRAKLEISAACHAHGKVPSHCVVTEFNDSAALQASATRAAREFGYTRMWSIHPAQIRPLLAAFAPTRDDIEVASKIIAASARVHWAPISFEGVLHDRASYRYFWQVLERAHHTGQPLPSAVQPWFATLCS
jgi:citrate lyase subunit beta/citryl-CoA lyase